MSRIKAMGAAILLSIAATSVQADIRLKGGQVLITRGDSLSELHQHIKPTRSYRGTVCTKLSNSKCKTRNTGYGTIREYKVSNRTWVVHSWRGVITYIEWKR